MSSGYTHTYLCKHILVPSPAPAQPWMALIGPEMCFPVAFGCCLLGEGGCHPVPAPLTVCLGMCVGWAATEMDINGGNVVLLGGSGEGQSWCQEKGKALR